MNVGGVDNPVLKDRLYYHLPVDIHEMLNDATKKFVNTITVTVPLIVFPACLLLLLPLTTFNVSLCELKFLQTHRETDTSFLKLQELSLRNTLFPRST